MAQSRSKASHLGQEFDEMLCTVRLEIRKPPDASASYCRTFLRYAGGLGLALAVGFSVLMGCSNGSGGPTGDREAVNLAEGPTVFGNTPSDAGSGAGAQGRALAAEDTAWTIVLAAFREDNHRAAAEASLPGIRAIAGLEGAFVTTRGRASFLGVGRFGDASDSRAAAELDRVRAIEVGASRPFAQSFLAPPATGDLAGSRPEFSLQRARERIGKGAFVTLQVGVYERVDVNTPSPADLAAIREAAEQAAAQLRREGEQAFYYHGPRRSMVTIGLLPEEDVTKERTPASAALKKRNPYNLLNGQGYRTTAGGPPRASEFVRVP